MQTVLCLSDVLIFDFFAGFPFAFQKRINRFSLFPERISHDGIVGGESLTLEKRNGFFTRQNKKRFKRLRSRPVLNSIH